MVEQTELLALVRCVCRVLKRRIQSLPRCPQFSLWPNLLFFSLFCYYFICANTHCARDGVLRHTHTRTLSDTASEDERAYDTCPPMFAPNIAIIQSCSRESFIVVMPTRCPAERWDEAIGFVSSRIRIVNAANVNGKICEFTGLSRHSGIPCCAYISPITFKALRQPHRFSCRVSYVCSECSPEK